MAVLARYPRSRSAQELTPLAFVGPTAPARGDESGKEIALIFDKTSTRTCSAFEVAAYDQGARVTYLDSSGSPAAGHERGSTS